MTPPVPWRSTHLERRPATIPDVATGSLGLYVAPPVSHLELAARVPGYSSLDLEDLLDRRLLIGLRCLRGSAFLMPVDLLAVVVPATRERNVRAFGTYLARSLTTADYETWAQRVDDVLGDEMLTKAELMKRLDPPAADRPFMSNVISQMATESRLVGVRVAASWRSAGIAYTRWSNWLPGVDVESPDPAAARATLARWYFDRFGPATVGDFAWWSGLIKSQASTAAVEAGIEAGDGGLLGTGPGGDPPTGVRLLPIWDTLFVTWKDRSRIIPDGFLPFVYDASGNATSVVLLDGVVAGVWAMGSDGDVLEVRAAPFGDFTSGQWNAIEQEATIVAGLAGASRVELVRLSDPPNLRTGKRNLFMTPV